MDTHAAFWAADVSATAAAVNELARQLGDPGLIDADDLAYQTGIPVSVIAAVLKGEDVDLDAASTSVQERLNFLRDSRLRPDGRQLPVDEIARRVGVSTAQVRNLLNGTRNPGLQVAVALEEVFGVEPGFLTLPWSRLLDRALQRVRDSLTKLALLKGVGMKQLALRSSLSLSDDRLGRELMDALVSVVGQPQPAHSQTQQSTAAHDDPEIRELAETISSLPGSRRRSVVPLIRGLLGLARSEPHDADDGHKR